MRAAARARRMDRERGGAEDPGGGSGMDIAGMGGRGFLAGVAGPYCSGKTTLASGLAAALGAELLHLDRFWIPGCEKPLVAGHPSRERPHQHDGTAMWREARALRNSGRGVFCEGLLAFLYPGAGEADILLFVDLPPREAERRRAARAAAGGNSVWEGLPGTGAGQAGDAGWLANGRREWELWDAPQACHPGAVALDGTMLPDALLGAALDAVRASRPDLFIQG